MLKRVIFLSLIILVGCHNPSSNNKAVRTESPAISKPSAVKPEANYWPVSSFAPKEGETEGRKYVKFITDGNFSDAAQTSKYLYAEVLVDKINAGIFLHKLSKASPSVKFNEPVHIKMTNSSGQELQMTSTRKWNNSGGILIERSNNDYSQFRIFLLKSTGFVKVEINGPASEIYNFSMYMDGFKDSFSKL